MTDMKAAREAFRENLGYTEDDDVEEEFNEAFLGDYNTYKDFVYSYVEDTGMLQGVPENIVCYFDYESFGRDLELSGDVWTATSPTGTYVFRTY